MTSSASCHGSCSTQASRFRQGEALLAGGFVPAPTITKIADRLTVEGGVDVPVPMP